MFCNICRLIIGLSVSLGLFLIELIGFFGGISMFMHTQGLICILLCVVIKLNEKNKFLRYVIIGAREKKWHVIS